MRRLLWILPLLLLLASCNDYRASRGPADWIYVATTGNDGTGDGSAGAPYLTLGHAVTQATAGDTIYVTAGTYNISTQVAVPVGVSIMGAGNTSILVLTWTTASSSQGCIQLSSYPTEGTNGNQSISHLYLDGDLTGTAAISVYCRSNVKIHDLTVVDFAQAGIGFRGNAAAGEATTKATGNQLYNCTITNSSSRTGGVTDGLIRMSSQSGLVIHDNVLTQTGRTTGNNGNIIDGVGGYNDGLQYYNNVSYKPYSEGAQWNFHIEMWNSRGGMNVYDNQFQGGGCHIDIGGDSSTKGSHDYSWWIHGNLFNQDALQAYNADGYYTVAVDLERNVQDAIIERNHIRRLNWGIELTADEGNGPERNHIRYNIFEEIGTTDNIWSAAVMLTTVDTGGGPENNYIDNNTITAGTAYNVGGGIIFAIYNGVAQNTHIRNNIIKGFMRPLWVAATQNPDTVYYQNNQSNNTSNNIYYSSGRAIGTLISAGNQTGDPLFRASGYYRLQSTSPAINAGLSVGLTSDFAGHRVPQQDTVDIGAYEYGNYLFRTPSGHLLRNANGKLMITH